MTQTKIIRHWSGIVVSDVNDKTIIVAVNRFVTHPKYLKKYRETKKYAVHDPQNRYKIGEKVTFRLCSPISKRKRFIVVSDK